MKISTISHNQESVALQNRPASGSSNFQALLDSKLKGMVEPHGSAPIGGALPASAATVPSALRIESLHLSEQTLHTLAQYEAALANPAFRSDELEPLVASLELSTAAIVDLKQQLPAADPLHHLVDRVAAVAYVEAFKFRRGDYAA